MLTHSHSSNMSQPRTHSHSHAQHSIFLPTHCFTRHRTALALLLTLLTLCSLTLLSANPPSFHVPRRLPKPLSVTVSTLTVHTYTDAVAHKPPAETPDTSTLKHQLDRLAFVTIYFTTPTDFHLTQLQRVGEQNSTTSNNSSTGTSSPSTLPQWRLRGLKSLTCNGISYSLMPFSSASLYAPQHKLYSAYHTYAKLHKDLRAALNNSEEHAIPETAFLALPFPQQAWLQHYFDTFSWQDSVQTDTDSDTDADSSAHNSHRGTAWSTAANAFSTVLLLSSNTAERELNMLSDEQLHNCELEIETLDREAWQQEIPQTQAQTPHPSQQPAAQDAVLSMLSSAGEQSHSSKATVVQVQSNGTNSTLPSHNNANTQPSILTTKPRPVAENVNRVLTVRLQNASFVELGEVDNFVVGLNSYSQALQDKSHPETAIKDDKLCEASIADQRLTFLETSVHATTGIMGPIIEAFAKPVLDETMGIVKRNVFDDLAKNFNHGMLSGVGPDVSKQTSKNIVLHLGMTLPDTISSAVSERVAASVTNVLCPAISKAVSEQVIPQVEEFVTRIISKQVPPVIDKDIPKAVASSLPGLMLKDTIQITSLALTSTLTKSISHFGNMARLCQVCAKHDKHCNDCAYVLKMDKKLNAFSAHYASWYSGYYSEYYSKAYDELKKNSM